MTVVSRTDLGLNRMTAEGILVYKKKDFVHKVAKILAMKIDQAVSN